MEVELSFAIAIVVIITDCLSVDLEMLSHSVLASVVSLRYVHIGFSDATVVVVHVNPLISILAIHSLKF